MHRFPSLFVALSLAGLPPQTSPPHGNAPEPAPKSSVLTIHLENKRGDKVQTVRPEHVFDTGDIVRFRVTASQNGYLYVLDHGSSGNYQVLFPAEGSAAGNNVQRGTDYLVPATGDGWFQVEAPAGFDTVYFLLSPTPLTVAPASHPATSVPATPPASLKPRCNDSVFQARGECVDDTAGPAPLARDAPLPPQIKLMAPQASRDIVLSTGDDESVDASAPSGQPVVYTFRLAHR